MAAIIRSTVSAVDVDGASRDDLVIGTAVTLTSIGAASTYNWSLVYVPEGSAAAFTGSTTAVSPGTFTPDLEGAYLIRLITDVGTGSEDTQYVRLRVVTDFASLHLISAGERRDASGIIPVDIDAVGWAHEQNANLQSLETFIKTRQFRDTLTETKQCSGVEVSKAVAQFRLAGTDLPPGLSYRLSLAHWVTDVALTGTWELYDLDNGEVIATGSTSSLSPTAATAALTLGTGAGELKDAATLYEIRLSIAGGTALSDVYLLGSVALEGVA